LAQYNYHSGTHELALFYNRPTSNEIKDVRRGPAEFALYVDGMLIVLLFRFGKTGLWSDAPYSIHLVPSEIRTIPQSMETWSNALQIVLVDASTGIIKALRLISMPDDFAEALNSAIVKQSTIQFTRARYNGALEDLFRRFSSEELAERAQAKFVSTSMLADKKS
jgi:hypothetical protein